MRLVMAVLFSASSLGFFSGNGKQSFNPILNPDADPDYNQNLTTSKLGQV